MSPTLTLLVLGVGAALACWVLLGPALRAWRINRKPFPAAWLAILHRNVPVYGRLPDALRFQLRQLIKRFIADKRFIGCGGQEITDEIRLTVAGSACLLLLNRRTSGYASLRYIHIYPAGFVATGAEMDEAGVVSTSRRELLGESWSDGKVVLSWDAVERGARNFSDGENVVLHEFAHQLDSESGAVNGAPLLASRAHYQSWARVLSAEFAALRRAGGTVGLDEYGATDPAEFFAVASEFFFEKPAMLAEDHPELFRELLTYYRVDPRLWQNAAAGRRNAIIGGGRS